MSTHSALKCDECGWLVLLPHVVSPRASVTYGMGWQRIANTDPQQDRCPRCAGVTS